MPLQIITPPTAEPVHLTDAKLHLRVDITDDDTLIAALVTAAREYAQGETRKQLVAARWKQVFDCFPCAPLALDRGPVIRVVSIQYMDMAGTTQTMPAANYVVDYSSSPVRITPVFGQVWPIAMPQIGSVWVTFDAGYATPITASGNNITVPLWSTLSVGDAVRLSNSGGLLPAPLSPATDYFVQSVVSPGVYTLAATAGGAVITLTNAGSGQSFLGVVPEGIKTWLKIRLSTLYENREEVALLQKGKIEPLPYVDRLLDAYREPSF